MLDNFTKDVSGTQIIRYLSAGFKTIILCYVQSIWFGKYAFSAELWFVKTSTRVVKDGSPSNVIRIIHINVTPLTVCYCHVTYAFQGESILYSCLIVKELRAQNRSNIWGLSGSNGTRTHNDLVRKRTLNHLRTYRLWVRAPLLLRNTHNTTGVYGSTFSKVLKTITWEKNARRRYLYSCSTMMKL